jgi:hypothetical protein
LASSDKSDITGAQNLHRPLAGSTARSRNLTSTRSGKSPSVEKLRTKRLVTPRIVTDHIMMQEDYERLHEFLLETDNLLEISNDLRKVIEEEWPELVYKLPPKA